MANTNIITTPNMDSVTGWGLYPSSAGYANSVASNILTNTIPATAADVESYAYATAGGATITDNHKYYCRGTAQVNSALCTVLALYLSCESFLLQAVNWQATPSTDVDYTISGILEWTFGYNTEMPVLAAVHRYASTGDAGGKHMDLKQWLLVDLTAEYGAGNEPDLTTCDAWDWWEGEQSTAMSRIVKVFHAMRNNDTY